MVHNVGPCPNVGPFPNVGPCLFSVVVSCCAEVLGSMLTQKGPFWDGVMLCMPTACRLCASDNASSDHHIHTHSANPLWQYYLGNPSAITTLSNTLTLRLVLMFCLCLWSHLKSYTPHLYHFHPTQFLPWLLSSSHTAGSHSHPLYAIPIGHILFLMIRL